MTTTRFTHATPSRSTFLRDTLNLFRGLLPAALRARPAAAAPAGSALENAVAEARRVRDMAHAYLRTDPGFAADLYAAAARHETLHGA